MTPTIERTTFRTSRLLDFLSEKELIAQTGHPPHEWPLVVLKELLDNALDACEEKGIPPEIDVVVNDEGITVADNGPGMPHETIQGVLDFSVRTSSREAYAAPDRGAQGNALKTVVAMPLVLSGNRGRVEVRSFGQKHVIEVAVDPSSQKPIVEVATEPSDVKNGTVVTVCWPEVTMDILDAAGGRFLQLAFDYGLLNPHLALTVKWFDEEEIGIPAAVPDWNKWRPNAPTSAHWYDPERFDRLVAAYIGHDRVQDKDRSVREFVAEFRGLSATAKQKRVLDEAGLARTPLSGLANCQGLQHELTAKLLEAMKANSRPVKPSALGVLGKSYILGRFADELEADVDTFEYRRVYVEGDDEQPPAVVEVAFAELPYYQDRRLVAGVNWSGGIALPFRGLDWVLAKQRVEDDAPVVVFTHVACPVVDYMDRGKSSIAVSRKLWNEIKQAIVKVTERWRKAQRQEEAEAERARRAKERADRRQKQEVSLKEAVFRVLPQAIENASGGGRVVFPIRNLYYAARDLVQAFTSRFLSYSWFKQLVDEYEAEHGDIGLMYRDPRGYLVEPHTGREIPLGTRAVDGYDFPLYLYDKILYCEKKGFHPIFQAFRLAEKYDMAIVCAEGYAVRAAKSLLSAAQTRDVVILCVHDADPAGYNISRTLRESTATFPGQIEIIDMGLRLGEALDMGLGTESFIREKALPSKLRLNDLERRYFQGERLSAKRWECQRVELNALSKSPDRFVGWIEDKLHEYGLDRKLLPPRKQVREHAVGRRANQLRDRVSREVASILDLESLEAEVVDCILPKVRLDRVPDDLEKWAAKLQPGRWCDQIDQHVDRLVAELDDEVHEAAVEAVKGMEAPK